MQPVAVLQGVPAPPPVVGYASSSNPAAKSYVMVANSFQDVGQTSLDLNKIATTATPATYKTRVASAPLLKIWDPPALNGAGNYTTYYYIDDCEDPEDDENEITAWATNRGEYPTTTVAAGQGFWLILPSTYTGAKVKFSSPLK